MKRRVNVYIEEDMILLARAKDEHFNLSQFCNDSLTHFVLGDVIYEDPRKIAAKRAAEEVLKERAKQRKIIEESQSYEQRVLEMMDRDNKLFYEKAELIFNNPERYIQLLPDYSGNVSEFWIRKAEELSVLCNFTINPERVINYVKEVTDVVR